MSKPIEFDYDVRVHCFGAGPPIVTVNGVEIDCTKIEIRHSVARVEPKTPAPIRKWRDDGGLARGLDLIATYQASWRTLPLRASGRRLRWRHDVQLGAGA